MQIHIFESLQLESSYVGGLLYSVLITKAWHNPYLLLPPVKDYIPYHILLSGDWAPKTVSTFWQCSLWVSQPENTSFLENLFMGISGSFCPSIGFPSFASALDIAYQEPINLQLTKHLILKCKQRGGFPMTSQYTGLLANKTQCGFFVHFPHW